MKTFSCCSGAYSTLHNSGVIELPTKRTLNDYRHYSPARCAFSAVNDMQIIEVLKKQKPTHLAKYVVVDLDEMYLKEGLVLQRSSGAVVGYQDLGDVNNILHDAESQIQCSSALKCKSVCTPESTKELLALSIADVLTLGVFLLYPFGTYLLN